MFDPARYDVEAFLSSPRLSRYRRSSNSEKEAVRLYFWNQELGAAFLGPLSLMEVTLRNAMHEALSSVYGECWIMDDSVCPLVEDDRASFTKVIDRLNPILTSRREHLTANAVVGSASLGDWVHLLAEGIPRSARYNYQKTLWEPALINAFPNNPDRLGRREIHGWFNNLRSFRNRVVHHEPIFHRRLDHVMEDIIQATSLINADAAEMIEEGNGLRSVLESKRNAVEGGDCCM